MSRATLFGFFAIVLGSLLCYGYWTLSVKQGIFSWSIIEPKTAYPDEWNTVNYIWVPTPNEKKNLQKIIEKRFENRRKVLEKFCLKFKSAGESAVPPSQLISTKDKKLTVCYIQKAASTSWNRLVWRLRHNVETIPTGVGGIRSDNLRDISQLNFREKQRLVETSLSVITVRHPFARLISGWNNKLNREFIRTHGNTLLRSMPELVQHFMTEAESPTHALTFERFLAFVINQSTNRTRVQWIRQLDSHFRPMLDICCPCDFMYKYVVKVETAPDDVWYVLDQIDVAMTTFISQTNVTSITWKGNQHMNDAAVLKEFAAHTKDVEHEISSSIRNYFKNVPPEHAHKLIKLYQSDFQAFGYSFDVKGLRAGGIT
uniref:Carbohydrate sulfotransferase n=1 Tax=Phallusia mammillata TaxID=59560 RepID=A0A6F9DA41_9ASCI|nr:carbohydrate sulfotransferase 11-like [Phallusia mammillata]